MGNSGSGASNYTPPPATPMPIEDSTAARHEAAVRVASRMSTASRVANDLDGASANDEPAITRSQIAKADTFTSQEQPRGPAGHRRRRSPAGAANALTASSVLTG